MAIVSPFTSKDDIQEQASLWVSKMDRGLSKDEINQFQEWMKQSDFHRSSVFSLAALWDDLSVLNELSALFPLENTNTRTNNYFTKYALAASVAFILLFSSSFYFSGTLFSPTKNDQQFVELKTLKTDVGQQTRFTLTDGSRIKLNTNTLVKVSYSKKQRLLTLVRGEARFDVAKDKSRPFIVTAGKQSFTALGTIFNVQKDTDKEMELVVTEGRVLVTKSSESLINISKVLTTLSVEQLPGLLVVSGEKSMITDSRKPAAKKASFEQIQRELAWQQGMLVFNGDPLAEALTEVSRYTTAEFEIFSPELATIKVAGYFKANDIDGLLKSLHSNFNINFEKLPNNKIRLTTSTSS
jgi:transmembrane sensor